MSWGSPEEIERRRRIRVAVWAYAYEIEDKPLVSDAQFDQECLLVNPEMKTGHQTLDRFFKMQFSPHTGQWVHNHPEWRKLKKLAARIRKWRKDGSRKD